MRLLQILVLLLFTVNIFSQGISFEAKSFDDAIAQAQAEDKYIFVDGYTTWCGPCKWLSANVFPEEAVGEYYNENFVNFKIDMEKGEGPDLAKKWEIKGYPTLLYLDKNGEVIHRSMGSRPVEEFIALGKDARNPEKQVVTLEKRFNAGDRNADFLKNYAVALTSAGMGNFGEVVELYMNTQDDWSTKENMEFIFEYSEASMDSKLFKYTLDHKDKFVAMVGEEKYKSKVNYAAEVDRSKKGIARDDVDGMQEHFKGYMTDLEAKNTAYVTYINTLMYSKDPVDQEKFESEVQLFLAGSPDVAWNFYNGAAWHIFETSDDSDLLKIANGWVDQSIAKEKNSFNVDTKANLLHKMGNKREALEVAKEAVKLAKEEGADPSSTNKLIDKITSEM